MGFGQTLARLVRASVLAIALIPCAARAAPPLATYGQLPGFEMASLSPSGDHVAIIGTVEDKRLLVVMDAARNPVYKVVIPSKSKIRGVDWVGDQAVLIDYSQTVVLGMDFTTNKAELGTVVVFPLDGSKAWVMFQGDADITGGVRGSYGLVQKNGRWFGYFGGITLQSSLGFDKYLSTTHPDLYEVDMQTRKHHIVGRHIEGDEDWRGWLVNDTGAIGAVLDVGSKTGQWTLTNGRGLKLASGKDPLGKVDLIGFTADGASVVYGLRDSAEAEDKWFSVPLTGGASQPYLDGIAVDRMMYDTGRRLIGYIEDNTSSSGHFFDPRHDKVYKASLRAFASARMVLTDANQAFDRLLVKTEGAGDPETWWMIDIRTGHADPLGYSYAVDPADVGPMKMVTYTAADGRKIEGVLTLPPDRPAKALPAVILPHGGPGSYDVIRFDWIAQAYASRGYAVFQPNFRGSTGYGAEFEQAGYGEWGRKMQTDLSDGLADLVRQGVVDPRRVCIVGASYGGYAALAGVSLQHGIYRCAVAVAGISDVMRMVNQDNYASGGDAMINRILKREIGSGHDLKAVSPIRFVDTIDAPILLIHGKDDTVVDYSQSSAMASALRQAGKPVEFVTLKDEDHWLSRSETRLQMLEAAVGFVIRNNPPDPAPPAKVP